MGVCKRLLDVENTFGPSTMFEEGEMNEMQPSLAVNKPACKHLPDFALRGCCRAWCRGSLAMNKKAEIHRIRNHATKTSKMDAKLAEKLPLLYLLVKIQLHCEYFSGRTRKPKLLEHDIISTTRNNKMQRLVARSGDLCGHGRLITMFILRLLLKASPCALSNTVAFVSVEWCRNVSYHCCANRAGSALFSKKQTADR